jgi:pimeloyl-ACP methyl ester carboxylesterase
MNLYKILIISSVILGIFGCSKSNTETYERFYFENDGASLAIQVDGNRTAKVFVLLLHGGPGGSGFEYNTGEFTEILEKEYAMVYLDQRGQGASKGSYNVENVTLQQFSDDIAALSTFLKQKYGSDISLFLMGHSWGGTTGTHSLLNTNVQADLKGWIEVDGAHDIPLLNKEAIKMFLEIGNAEISAGNNTEKWQEIVDFATKVDTNNITVDEGGQINAYGFEAEGLMAQITSGTSGEPSHGFLTSPLTSLTNTLSGSATANAINAETEKASMTADLNKITIPSLFLWGKYDFVVPPSLGQMAFDKVSSTEKEIVIFEYSGHSPMDNEATLFSAKVIQFIELHK